MATRRLAALLLLLPCLANCVAPEADDDAEAQAAEDELRALPGRPADRSTLPAGYDALPAAQKQELLWTMIQTGRYCAKTDTQGTCLAKLPTGGFGYYIRAIPALLSLRPTFHHASDEAPEGRRKIFHPFGVAGRAEFIADYTDAPSAQGVSRRAPYSGLLANDRKAIPLILRLAPGGGPNLIPGASVKFLIDGKPSRNFVAIKDFAGVPDDDWNYFQQDIGHIYPDVPYLLKIYFQTQTRDPSHLPVHHLGEITASGADVAEGARSTPYEIVLRPNAAVASRFPNGDQHDYRLDLTRIEAGTPVYDVMARAKEWDRTFEKLGTIRTTSELVASEGGDKQLYFKHPGAKE
ncbi:MAG: hypothetical protein KF819_34710 [Labilithrix sp.]|nr:hypothetical protein [Labilithrix sp.]